MVSIEGSNALPVLDHDALEHVGDVLAAVGRGSRKSSISFHLMIAIGSLLVVEQPAQRLLVDAVGLVLEAVDLDGVRDEPLVLLEGLERHLLTCSVDA